MPPPQARRKVPNMQTEGKTKGTPAPLRRSAPPGIFGPLPVEETTAGGW